VTNHHASDHPYLAGLFALTMATGAVDAVSYLALDRVFTGNMTGNVLFVGFGFTGVDGIPLLNNAIALVGFVVGVIVCGLAVRARTHHTRLPNANLIALIVTAAIIVVLSAAWLAVGHLRGYWLLVVTAVLAVAMGAQAVAVRAARIPDVSTIVITTTLVNLALDSPLAGGSGDKWARRLVAVLAMGAGAAVGAIAIRWWSGAGALLVAAVIMVIGAVALAWARHFESARRAPAA
jgi:Predicted membrane protein